MERVAELLDRVPGFFTPQEYRVRNPYDDALERETRRAEREIREMERRYEDAKAAHRIAVHKEEMDDGIRRAYRSKAIRHRLRGWGREG